MGVIIGKEHRALPLGEDQMWILHLTLLVSFIVFCLYVYEFVPARRLDCESVPNKQLWSLF